MSPSRWRLDASSPLILVIDDAEDSRDVYVQYLQHLGLRSVTAADGEDGLEKALALRPSLIVLDLSLPKLDGWEVTRRLKANPTTRGIPVIAVSGHAHPEQKRLAVEAGVDDYCVKPCTPGDLLAMIERHLR